MSKDYIYTFNRGPVQYSYEYKEYYALRRTTLRPYTEVGSDMMVIDRPGKRQLLPGEYSGSRILLPERESDAMKR